MTSFTFTQSPVINSNQEIIENSKEHSVVLTSELIVDGVSSAAKSTPITDPFEPKAIVNPAVILRGGSFTVEGWLYDNATGTPVGIDLEEVMVFWDIFDWDDYAADPSGYIATYTVGSGYTDSNGNYSISCTASHSRTAGLRTLYIIWDGNPARGYFEGKETTEIIECYATVAMILQTETTIVREGDTFWAAAGLIYDNITTPTPVLQANGDDILFEWLGNNTDVQIVSFVANETLIVPTGTPLGVGHTLQLSYNISKLNLPYTVGSISNVAQLGTEAAKWCNTSRSIEAFSGAGIVFDIDDPVPPGAGLNPEVLRGDTLINVTGVLTDSDGNPYGYSVDISLFVGTQNTTSTTADNAGLFSFSFQITSSLVVGDYNLSIDVNTYQPIVAQTELKEITIVGNSTLTTPSVNTVPVDSERQLMIANETFQITGRIIDDYSGANVVNMPVYAQYETFGVPLATISSGTGTYTFDMVIPETINPNLENGTVRIWTDSIQYYTAYNTSFLVDVFTDVEFELKLDQTTVVDGATVTTIGGVPIYNTTSFVFNTTLIDRFGRPMAAREINITVNDGITNLITQPVTLDANGNFIVPITNYITLQAGNYTITILFLDDQNYDFSFTLTVAEIPYTPPTSPTSNGGFNLSSQFAIGILIAMVSLIIIVSIVYAFGRFRKSKRQTPGGVSGAEILDLPTIMKQIAESENAKDYRRAVILCYHAFELICMQDMRIFNARSQSPRELARLVASTNRIPVRDVTMLIMRFEESRFSDHKISKNSFTQAKQALDNVLLALKQDAKIA